MNSQFEYFESIKRAYPKTMNKEEFYRIAHISKATALYLLQSGLVPCKDTGKKTRRYTIRTKDVIAYLQDRILYPNKYAAPDGWYIGRSQGTAKRIEGSVNREIYFSDEQRVLLKEYFFEEMSELDDLLTVTDFSQFLGYSKKAVIMWCNKNKLHHFYIARKFIIPKMSAIDYLASDASLSIRRKSYKHQLFIADFMNRNGIAR